jgi:hypothetical protein
MLGLYFNLVVWGLLTIFYFSKPKDKILPNWTVGLITLAMTLKILGDILGKIK